MKKISIRCAIFFITLTTRAQQYPFQKSEFSSEERANDLINRLTIEEKSALMCDESEAIPRLGIKKFNWWSEGLHGIR